MLSKESKWVLGRLLADKGCKRLFRSSPSALMQLLNVALTENDVAVLRASIDMLDNCSVSDASRLSSELGNWERWKRE